MPTVRLIQPNTRTALALAGGATALALAVGGAALAVCGPGPTAFLMTAAGAFGGLGGACLLAEELNRRPVPAIEPVRPGGAAPGSNVVAAVGVGIPAGFLLIWVASALARVAIG